MTSTTSVRESSRRIIELLFGPRAERPFAVEYWDGTREPSKRLSAPFTLRLSHPSALRTMLLPPSEISFASAFLRGELEVDGDICGAIDAAEQALGNLRSIRRAAHVLRLAASLPRRTDAPDLGRHTRRLPLGRKHSKQRDREAVRFHYDTGNEFFALWLDEHMVYSCGYFQRGDEDLETAQRAKLDHICRKLRLQPGERLLDIGCGWGALVMHAARHYGVQAVGITLSEPQAAYAAFRAAREGLTGRVKIQVRDYRELDRSQQFDKIASVGMVEHVGGPRLNEYFAAAHRVLRPGGLFLNHGIVSLSRARPQTLGDRVQGALSRRGAFIDRFVFPDGDLVPTATVLGSAEGQGFEVRDVESLREHYVTTLRHWVWRLEARAPQARAIAGDVAFRVWRLYMAASANGFRSGEIGIIQSLLAKSDASGRVALPRTRADLYAAPSEARPKLLKTS